MVVHRIAPRYFFGFGHVPQGEFDVPVSDVEKTAIDLVYYGESPGRDVLRAAVRGADMGVLEGYLRRYPPAFVSKFRSAAGLG